MQIFITLYPSVRRPSHPPILKCNGTCGPPCILQVHSHISFNWAHLKMLRSSALKFINGLTYMFVIFDKSCIYIYNSVISFIVCIVFFWSTLTVFILILRFFLFLFLSSARQRLCLTYIFSIFIIFV